MTKARVLIADDAVAMRTVLKRQLADSPFEIVAEAANGAEAVKHFKKFKPDIVLMDIIMPVQDGLAATREIVAQDAKALIVLCSALPQQSLAAQAIAAGAVEFLEKPFTWEQLQKTLTQVWRLQAASALDMR